jgi:hypothetical protein
MCKMTDLCCKQLSSGILVVPAELGGAAALVVLQEVEVFGVLGCPVEPCRRSLELVLVDQSSVVLQVKCVFTLHTICTKDEL